jgi:hypothetical protein
MLVRAPLALATARHPHHAIESALEEHPARTGQAERCRNQDSCDPTSQHSIFLSHSILMGNCMRSEHHAYNRRTLSVGSSYFNRAGEAAR